MNAIYWTLVAILCQIVYAVSFAGLIRLRFAIWVKHLMLAGGIVLFGCTVFWYAMGWVDGLWQLGRDNTGFILWLIRNILLHVMVSGAIFATSWSMLVGTIIAASSRLDEDNILRPHRKSLFGWIMVKSGKEYTSICMLSWLIGGLPVLFVFTAIITIIEAIFKVLAAVLIFILIGANPWTVLREMFFTNKPVDEVKILRWGKVPVIPSIPLLLIGLTWLSFSKPAVALITIMTIAALVGLFYFIIFRIRETRWIKLYQEIAKKELASQAPTSTTASYKANRFKVSPIRSSIMRFFRRSATFIWASWNFLYGLKNSFCPMVIIDKTSDK